MIRGAKIAAKAHRFCPHVMNVELMKRITVFWLPAFDVNTKIVPFCYAFVYKPLSVQRLCWSFELNVHFFRTETDYSTNRSHLWQAKRF